MLLKILFVIIFINSKEVVSKEVDDYYTIYIQNDSYRGEKFPVEYLSTDGVTPTHEDFTYYMNTLFRIIDYFTLQLNETDPNVGIGSYLMKAVLKRVLLDYSYKIKEEEKAIIKVMINKAEDIVSYFRYDSKRYPIGDLGHDLSQLFVYDDSLVVSIGKHNRNAMQRWITSNLHLNEYNEQFDDLTLPKELYAEFVIDMEKYYPVSDSDFCIAKVSALQMPILKNDVMKHCPIKYCEQKALQMPSIAYALSHRLLFLVLTALTRRCYILSEAKDKMHMDIMCANMYRETVYLARRGYFYRDLFMEHIALCGLLGYEEFYRTRWFKKTASWIDEDGCMEEFRNFEVNRTRIYVARQDSPRAKKTMKRIRRTYLNEECSHHQMALAMNVLAYGMRHAAHYMKPSK